MKINKGYIYILLSALCFAIGGLLIKLNTWSAITINGTRCIFALMIFYPYYKKLGHKFIVNKVVIWGALVNTGMCFSFVLANKMTTAANAIVLQFTLPIHIIILLWLFWKKKPDKISVLTAAVCFVGILCFFFENLSPTGMTGNILAILSGFLYAIVFLIKKMDGADFESSVVLSFIINFIIGLPFLIRETDFGANNIITIMALGFVQLGLAYVFLNKGLDLVSPVGASILSMAEPITNPILVAIFYHEYIGSLSLVGAVIVLGAALFYSIRSSSAETE